MAKIVAENPDPSSTTDQKIYPELSGLEKIDPGMDVILRAFPRENGSNIGVEFILVNRSGASLRIKFHLPIKMEEFPESLIDLKSLVFNKGRSRTIKDALSIAYSQILAYHIPIVGQFGIELTGKSSVYFTIDGEEFGIFRKLSLNAVSAFFRKIPQKPAVQKRPPVRVNHTGRPKPKS